MGYCNNDNESIESELKNYVHIGDINHNFVSEEQWKLNMNAPEIGANKTNSGNITIYYFSENINLNPDIEMIKPALLKLLNEYKIVKILLFLEFSLPNSLNNFPEKNINKKFPGWKELKNIL